MNDLDFHKLRRLNSLIEVWLGWWVAQHSTALPHGQHGQLPQALLLLETSDPLRDVHLLDLSREPAYNYQKGKKKKYKHRSTSTTNDFLKLIIIFYLRTKKEYQNKVNSR